MYPRFIMTWLSHPVKWFLTFLRRLFLPPIPLPASPSYHTCQVDYNFENMNTLTSIYLKRNSEAPTIIFSRSILFCIHVFRYTVFPIFSLLISDFQNPKLHYIIRAQF